VFIYWSSQIKTQYAKVWVSFTLKTLLINVPKQEFRQPVGSQINVQRAVGSHLYRGFDDVCHIVSIRVCFSDELLPCTYIYPINLKVKVKSLCLTKHQVMKT
jgi:hypothetical protein